MKLRDRGFVEIELDQVRHLKVDFRAARLIEQKLGQPISKLTGESIGITELIIMFYAALAHENIKDWSVEKAEDLMMEAESIEYVTNKIGESVQLFFGEAKNKKN